MMRGVVFGIESIPGLSDLLEQLTDVLNQCESGCVVFLDQLKSSYTLSHRSYAGVYTLLAPALIVSIIHPLFSSL